MEFLGKKFADMDKKRINMLCQNLPGIIRYFKNFSNDISKQIAEKQQYKARLVANLSTANTNKTVNKYTGEVEASDYDDYMFYISSVENAIQDLQSKLNLPNLLNELLQTQIKKQEVQECINWQESAEYASINRYEKDDEEPATNYNSLLQKYIDKEKVILEKCLQNKDLRNYLDMMVAEKSKRNIYSNIRTYHR
jgi:hypothetical protein